MENENNERNNTLQKATNHANRMMVFGGYFALIYETILFAFVASICANYDFFIDRPYFAIIELEFLIVFAHAAILGFKIASVRKYDLQTVKEIVKLKPYFDKYKTIKKMIVIATIGVVLFIYFAADDPSSSFAEDLASLPIISLILIPIVIVPTIFVLLALIPIAIAHSYYIKTIKEIEHSEKTATSERTVNQISASNAAKEDLHKDKASAEPIKKAAAKNEALEIALISVERSANTAMWISIAALVLTLFFSASAIFGNMLQTLGASFLFGATLGMFSSPLSDAARTASAINSAILAVAIFNMLAIVFAVILKNMSKKAPSDASASAFTSSLMLFDIIFVGFLLVSKGDLLYVVLPYIPTIISFIFLHVGGRKILSVAKPPIRSKRI